MWVYVLVRGARAGSTTSLGGGGAGTGKRVRRKGLRRVWFACEQRTAVRHWLPFAPTGRLIGRHCTKNERTSQVLLRRGCSSAFRPNCWHCTRHMLNGRMRDAADALPHRVAGQRCCHRWVQAMCEYAVHGGRGKELPPVREGAAPQQKRKGKGKKRKKRSVENAKTGAGAPPARGGGARAATAKQEKGNAKTAPAEPQKTDVGCQFLRPPCLICFGQLENI